MRIEFYDVHGRPYPPAQNFYLAILLSHINDFDSLATMVSCLVNIFEKSTCLVSSLFTMLINLGNRRCGATKSVPGLSL